jgi:hypothetical protein
MDRFADDGKLGQGFTSADDLIEVDDQKKWILLASYS